jgi:opacity protein-like surface antigen
MSIHRIVLAVLVLLVLPAVCFAAPPRPGAYVSGFIGAAIPSNSEATGNDFVSGANFNDRVEFDPGIYTGGTGGYDFGFFRLEGEMSYRHSDIKAINDLIGNDRFRGVDGNLGVFSMMANGFLDLHNNSPVTPYFGGGIGFAAMHLTDTFGVSTSNGVRTLLYGEADDTAFAYQIGAGLEITLNPRFSLDVGYRYFRTDPADFESDLAIDTSMRFESHNAAIGFRFTF